jgi:hypothetical protein
MKLALWMRAACVAVVAFAALPAANAQDASGKQDRLSLMVAGHTLTNTNGGWGASALWLHNFSADTLFGLGAETQTIGEARWTFGKLSFNHGSGDAQSRTNVYFDAAVGSGEDNIHTYDYLIGTVGVFQNLTKQLTLQIEDKQINVDTSHGNLPKLGLQYLWSPHLSTSLAYAYSVSGSLDTRLAMARIDGYTKTMNVFAGLANGQAAPIVTGLPAGTPVPGFILHQYYVGVGRTFSRADTTAVLDYVRLGNSNHWTLTFNAMLHQRTGAAP